MINHFHSWLLNRSPELLTDSLWPVDWDDSFVPTPQVGAVLQIDTILFGKNPDPSYLDYRYFQFLRLINACQLREHVRRFDSRETYNEKDFQFSDGPGFMTNIEPGTGLRLTEQPGTPDGLLRRRFSVICRPDQNVPISVFFDGDRTKPARLNRTLDVSGVLESFGLTLTAIQTGAWSVDYRRRPEREVTQIISTILDLPAPVYRELFALIRDFAPEYEEGFRTITDSLTKFCMILFAQAIANERSKDVTSSMKRLSESETVDVPANAEGTLYYGTHSAGSLRIRDIKTELNPIINVTSRRQNIVIPVPSLSYLYLAWPTRFGLPAHQRIIVDGFLNSAWIVSYAEDVEEQYTILRSENKVRTSTPIRLEIL